MHRKNNIMEEKQILTSFISKLPEAILICDAGGSILLHDRQSETWLLPAHRSSRVPVSMNGTPITAYIDKDLMEHALDDMNEQLKQQVSNTVSTFILQKNTRILQAQVVPVLSHTSLFTGFVVILDDITQQSLAEKRVESLLKTLSKNARSPMAGIRAAIEAMRQFPGMDKEKQGKFKEIIYHESVALSDLLNRISEDYTCLIQTKKSLTTVFLRDLLQTVSRRGRRDKPGIFCHIIENKKNLDIKIKADTYLMITAIFFVLERVKTETGAVEFGISFKTENQVVLMDITWKGGPIDPRLIRQWESLAINTRHAVLNISLKEALNQHHSALSTCPGQTGEKEPPGLRFFIPEDVSPVRESFEPVSALPETRIQIRDLDLFDHSDQDMELDNRLLTELSYTSLIREITRAGQVEEIIGKHSQLPRLIHSMLTSGTKIRTVTWLVTAFSDAILHRLIAFAMAELGPPPVPFAFITLGSEGRKEQTLKTDQDNAIIFQDPPPGHTIETLQPYFLLLGEKVCAWLDQSGFDFCQGGIMAKNPEWCQPLSKWKHYFSSWIHAAAPEDLLHTSIFFDFRFAYGDQAITDDLTTHLLTSLSNWIGFFRNMAKNAVYFQPPIGFFGNFQVNAHGPHKNCLDIKMASIPIVDFARIYALKQGIKQTATQERLYQLYVKKILSKEAYNELDQAYSFMMQIRFKVQIQAILGQNLNPDNYVNPRHLSSIEKRTLKEILKKIKDIQAKLRFDFIGATDQQIS
jgi:CBS domain-containing protein